MNFFNKSILYIYQDLKVKRKIVIIVMLFIILLMTAATIPNNSAPLLEWNSTKDFILLFRYEFLHVPAFLILVGSTYIINDWITIRRYKNREQIGAVKVLSVIVLSSLFTFIIMVVGLACTFIVKFILFPNISNYASLFLFMPKDEPKGSFIYFICIYFFLTTVIGLLFILLTAIIRNQVLSAAIIITAVILDRFTVSLIPYFLYSSEINSPIVTFVIFICIITILVNSVGLTSNNEDFFVKEEKI